MVQTKEGAKKTVIILKERYGSDYFSRIGSNGGKKPKRKALK